MQAGDGTGEGTGDGSNEDIHPQVRKFLVWLRAQRQTKWWVRVVHSVIAGVGPEPIAVRSIAQTRSGSDLKHGLEVTN